MASFQNIEVLPYYSLPVGIHKVQRLGIDGQKVRMLFMARGLVHWYKVPATFQRELNRANIDTDRRFRIQVRPDGYTLSLMP